MDKEVIEALAVIRANLRDHERRARALGVRDTDAVRDALVVLLDAEAYLTDPGYRRVPVEPTEAMLEAAFAAIDEMEMNTVTKADAAYAAMLSASQGEGE